jgi:DNA replication licensing factor MCM3
MYYINFEGSFGRNHVTPRGLRAELLNQYVTVTGIVTKMSIVRPHIQTSLHYCEETKRGHIKHYRDGQNLDQLANEQEDEGIIGLEDNNGFKVADNNGNPLSAEYGYCIYKDFQEITIQEMPERAPTG